MAAASPFRPLVQRLTPRRLIAAAASLGVVYLAAPPLVLTLVSAFRVPAHSLPFDSGAAWGLSNFTSLYTGGALLSTFLDTAVFAGASVLLGSAAALAIAWLLDRTDLPLRGPVFALLLLPVLLPSVVSTIAWVLLLGERTGAVNAAIRWLLPLWETGPIDVFSMLGMVLVQGFSLAPLLVVFFASALRGVDPALEEAARASGLPPWRVMTGVTLPLLRPHLLAGVLLALIFSIEAFEVPLLLSLGADADILAARVYFALNDAAGGPPRYGTVGAIGVHFLLITYALFFAYQRLAGDERRFAAPRRSPRAPVRLGRWRWAAFGGVALVLGLLSGAPLLVLAWTSLHPQYVQPSLAALGDVSLAQYRDLFADGRVIGALGNTALVAVCAPAIGVGVALLAAWSVQRRVLPHGLRWTLDALASSSIAVPSVIAANGLLLFYLRLNRLAPDWLPLFGSVMVLVLAYAYRLSIAYRIQRAGLGQTGETPEEAAYVSGGGVWSALLRVTAPMLRPSWAGAWLLLGLVAFRELTLPLVLNRGGPPHLVSTLVWELWGRRTGEAAALGVLSAVVAALFLLVGWRLLLSNRRA